MNETIIQVDDYGRVVQQDRKNNRHRFLLERRSTFDSLEGLVDHIYEMERTAPWRNNNQRTNDGLVLDLRQNG
jgi:hypothetical protein